MCSDANRVKFAEQIEKRNLINWIPGIVREMWASAFSRRCRHCCCCYPACFSLLLFASTPTITRSLSSSPRFFPPYHSPMDKLFNRRFSRFCWVTLDSVLCSPRFSRHNTLQHQNPLEKQHFPSSSWALVLEARAPTLWHRWGSQMKIESHRIVDDDDPTVNGRE